MENFSKHEIDGLLFQLYPENGLTPKEIEEKAKSTLDYSVFSKASTFILTNSELFSRWISVLRSKKERVIFMSISIDKDAEELKFDIDTRFDLLEPNHLIAEAVRLYKKEIEFGLGGNHE